MKRTAWMWLTAFILFFLTASLAFVDRAAAQEKIRIGISSSSPGFLPTVVAEQKGFLLNTGWYPNTFAFPCR